MNTERIDKAMSLAYKYHEGQMYGDNPYTYHLESVANKVMELYPNDSYLEELIVVAWLHDILEDTLCYLWHLEWEIGEPSTTAILFLTQGKNEPRGQYLNDIKSSVGSEAGQIAYRVKVADALCNLQESVINGDSRRVKRYCDTISILFNRGK